jgi:signal recognition particle receptor subunit beta
MALVNHAKKEINAKIVYYGPAGSGKGAALEYIYSRIKPSLRGDLKSIPSGSDNLLFFDFNPFETSLPNGYRVRLHVYTLTGMVTNPATWKMTLKGADGIIIMVTPDIERAAETEESVSQLRILLSAYGISLQDAAAVLQINSNTRGLQSDGAAEIASTLDLSMLSIYRSNVSGGEGLLEPLTALSRRILDRISEKNEEYHTDINRTRPSFEAGAAELTGEPNRQEPLPPPQNTPGTGSVPHIALVSREVVSDTRSIRIPVEISQGDTRHKLIVNVNIELG